MINTHGNHYGQEEKTPEFTLYSKGDTYGPAKGLEDKLLGIPDDTVRMDNKKLAETLEDALKKLEIEGAGKKPSAKEIMVYFQREKIYNILKDEYEETPRNSEIKEWLQKVFDQLRRHMLPKLDSYIQAIKNSQKPNSTAFGHNLISQFNDLPEIRQKGLRAEVYSSTDTALDFIGGVDGFIEITDPDGKILKQILIDVTTNKPALKAKEAKRKKHQSFADMIYFFEKDDILPEDADPVKIRAAKKPHFKKLVQSLAKSVELKSGLR